MNNLELQAIRKLLMLDIAEAAAHIAEVSTRSWQYWEAGRSPVPADVANNMHTFAQLRQQTLDMRLAQCEELADGEHLPLAFYQNIEAYEAATSKRNIILWRITQSIAAQLYAEGLAQLVPTGGTHIDA